MLHGPQAGQSLITTLRKREAFRAEFDGFDPERVAGWDMARIDRALRNPGIVRHRGKIESAVRGARLFLEIESRNGFAPFLWSFVGGQPIQNRFAAMAQVPTATPESAAMSRALKQRGFNFCGPVITYAFMQATGMVNDHIVGCHRHAALSRPQAAG